MLTLPTKKKRLGRKDGGLWNGREEITRGIRALYGG